MEKELKKYITDKVYIAHKLDEPYKIQSVKEHLLNTAELSGNFAGEFNSESFGYIVGILHDLGKFSPDFYDRIVNKGKKCDHSTAGAKYLWENKKKFSSIISEILGIVIVSHHSGLLNYGYEFELDDGGSYLGRMRKSIPDYSAYKNEIDLDELKIFNVNLKMSNLCFFMWIKMLFSCLVDADYLDTEMFMSQGRVNRKIEYSFGSMLEQLMLKLKGFNRIGELNQLRTSIRLQCEEKANTSKGIFSLTVPTGGGKTLSSMTFALKQINKKNFGLKRIIYVIPFTSIIEQNADVYRNIFGNELVLEHHSGVDYGDDESEYTTLKYASENWDVPIIVTTNVQFFESLMSSKTSKCRKLHNIANSVVIFDEVQAMPSYYNKICYSMINELYKNYNCSIVLCSATQPDYSKLIEDTKVIEICNNPQYLFDKLKRCEISYIEYIEIENLIEKIEQNSQVLIIVNTKKDAKNIYELINGENTFHLSRYMCAEHRRNVLNEVKKRLDNNEPVKLISTNLIEAGVDIDFPVVYREITGIDSIIQAAGRCNREGRLKNGLGKVFVFGIKKDKPYNLKNPFYVDLMAKICISKQLFDKYEDITNLSAINEYFEILYSLTYNDMDRGDLYKKISDANEICLKKGKPQFEFEEYAKEFNMIDTDTYSVIVPYNDEAEEVIDEIRKQIRFNMLSYSAIRKAQKYIVTLYNYEIEELTKNKCVSQIGNSMFILNDADVYKKEGAGIELNIETGIAIFI